MEHFYHDIDGYMNHRNTIMLDIVLEQFPAAGTWVELGSWTGRSTAYCVVELVNRSKLGPFYCVDTWQGGAEHQDHEFVTKQSLRDQFDTNLAPISGQYTPVESISWEAAHAFADESVDFCYVDAGHTYSDVTNDLTAWYPKIRPGCYFAGDDYTKGWPEVQRAVWDFFNPRGIKVHRSGRCWIVTKPIADHNLI